MTIYPQRDRILVQRDESESVTAGGIVLPENLQRDRPQKGTVRAVGPGRRVVTSLGTVVHEPIDYQVGDVVLFTKYAGEGFRVDGQEVFLVKDEDIIAVIAED